MTIALVLFALAALGGVVMAAMRLRGAERPPTGLALVHGALAAAGLIALIAAVVNMTDPGAARTSLLVFVLAAVGGFFLFVQHVQKKALPIPVVVIHGLIAVVGFVILLMAVVQPR